MNAGRAILAAVAAAALLFAAAGSTAAATRAAPRVPSQKSPPPSGMMRYLQRAEAAIERASVADASDAAAVATQLSGLIEDPLFAMLPKPAQRMLVSAKAFAQLRQGHLLQARDLYLQATRIDGNEPGEWYWLAIIELDLGRRARSAHYLTALINRWPFLANKLDPHVLSNLVYQGTGDEAVRTALMQALFEAGWDDRGNGVDDVWRQLALARLATGDTVLAAKVVATLTDPLVIIKVRSDKRFDALAPVVEALPTAQDAAERKVAELRALARESPARIDLAAALGTALLVAGRHEEAVAAADATLAAIETGNPAEFERLDWEVWVRNNRAIALRRLGRIDEAVAEMERASRIHERGAPNVSQVLNLGVLHCHLERPEAALGAVTRVGSGISGYGRMVLESIRHCAALQTGNKAMAGEALGYLRAHRSDSHTLLILALLREGRLDEAAAGLIAQLEDEKERATGLEFVQQFRTGPQLPGNRALATVRLALLARADVRAAVERVGRAGVHEVFDVTGIE